MFYIDEYGSKAVVNSPPSKVAREQLMKDAQNDMLELFWYSVGVTIAEQFDSMKKLLDKYGFKVSNENEAADAISKILHTKRWPIFAEEMSPMIHKTIDMKFPAVAEM